MLRLERTGKAGWGGGGCGVCEELCHGVKEVDDYEGVHDDVKDGGDICCVRGIGGVRRCMSMVGVTM